MYRERARSVEFISLLLDTGAILIAFGMAFLFRVIHDGLPLLAAIPSTPWQAERAIGSEYALIVLANLATVFVYGRFRGVYRTSLRFSPVVMVRYYAKTLVLAVLVTGLVVFTFRMSPSRLLFGYFFVFLFLTLGTKQLITIWLYRRTEDDDRYQHHALIIGPTPAALWFAQVVLSARAHGHELSGILTTDGGAVPDGSGVARLGSLDDLSDVLQTHSISEIFLVGAGRDVGAFPSLAEQLIKTGRVVSIVSMPKTGDSGIRARITEFSGVPVISYGPMPSDRLDNGIRRALDVTVSFFVLLLISPLLIAIAIAVRLSDGGPALFRQERLGRGGTHFLLYKFRSMRVDAEHALRQDPTLYRRYVENDYKIPESQDPRISTFGRFLRRTSLDELPQLWNVLRGDMTLVGPRPIVPQELEKYKPYERLFLQRSPGLTGQWQTSGRSDIHYPERAFMDLDYIASQSILKDLELIARTVPAVVRRRGAH